MAFYRTDRENDRARDVIRKNRYRASEFWGSGLPGQNFLITGGNVANQIWGLYYAVEDYLLRKRCPVIILHNSPSLDSTFYPELKARFPDIQYEYFGPDARTYQPFAGMRKAAVKAVLRELCDGDVDMEAYADAFIDILSCYERSLSLNYIKKLCAEKDAGIIQLAENAGMARPVGISETAGRKFRQVISRLSDSADNVYGGRLRLNFEKSITSILSSRKNDQVISIAAGSGHTDTFLKYLAHELMETGSQEFLVVVYDLEIRPENGLKTLLTKTSAHYTTGLCSKEIYSMFVEDGDRTYRSVRSRIKKIMILKYFDAGAAENIANIAGEYEKEIKQKIVAPVMPWQFIKPKAVAKPKQKYPRLEADELTEMGPDACMLYGHAGHSVYFVTDMDYR